MCAINTLVQEKYGYIATCEKCQVFYLTFGNFSMQLQEDDFRIYIEFINNFCKIHARERDHFCRSIKINTLIDNLQLILSYRELMQLREMMFEAILVYETEQLLQIEK